jgi:hypothetical protein
MFGFTPTTSLAVRGEKLGEIRESLSRTEVCIGELFSQEEWLCSTLLTTMQKVATHVDCPQEAYMSRMWTARGKCTCHIDQIFPAWCTSICITASLRYE